MNNLKIESQLKNYQLKSKTLNNRDIFEKSSIIKNTKYTIDIIENNLNISDNNLEESIGSKPNKINKQLILNPKFNRYNKTPHIYEFINKTFNKKILSRRINIILNNAFYKMNYFTSQPIFYIDNNNAYINLFIYKNNKNNNNNNNNYKNLLKNNLKIIEILNLKLSLFIKKNIILQLTRISSISHNVEIFTKILGLLTIPKKYNFLRIVKKFLRYHGKKVFIDNTNKTSLKGISFKLGGRLLKDRVIPKKSQFLKSKGYFNKDNKHYITTARTINKNKRGSFALTIRFNHKLNNLI